MAVLVEGPLEVVAPASDLAVLGVGPGPAAAGLLEGMVLADGALDLEVAADPVVLEDLGDLEVDGGGGALACPGLAEPALQRGQALDRGGEVALPPGLLLEGEQRAPDPGDRPDLGRRQGMAVDEPAIPGSAPVAGVGSVPDLVPGDGLGLDRAPELPVLEPGPRHHRDEAAAVAVDMVEVVVAAELGVGDVQEVRSPGEGLEGLPGLDMGDRVAGVAGGAAKLHRDAAIGGRRQDEQQLLEVRAVILGVAVDDQRGAAAPTPQQRRCGTGRRTGSRSSRCAARRSRPRRPCRP